MSSEPFLRIGSHRSSDRPRLGSFDTSSRNVRRRRAPKARDIQMFLHGGESTLVTEEGDYNIHRLVPTYVKYYLNWTRDTFPSIVRLGWLSLMSVFILIKLLTIFLFAVCIDLFDADRLCVANASTHSDYFYFVVQTIFTIGYGNMYPTCHMTNLMVTVISFLGMFQMATFTGIFFAKFSMDPRRNYACAFSTKLVGIPPALHDPHDEMVRFNFRFVNVFHRRYFNVSCRLFLIEHRLNPVTEKWLTPHVEELNYYDTSAPLDFMSLPIEVCAYIPFSRLVKRGGTLSGTASPGLEPSLAPGQSPRHYPTTTAYHHKWVRHFSNSYRQQMFAQAPYSSSFSNVSEIGTPRVLEDDIHDEIPVNPEFELMCMLVFTDATTGSEIAVRKSWPLAESIWLTPAESRVHWKDIIQRDEEADSYYVDVTGLDKIDNRSDAFIDYAHMAPSPMVGARSPADMTYALINTMTMPARGGTHGRAGFDRPQTIREVFSSEKNDV